MKITTTIMYTTVSTETSSHHYNLRGSRSGYAELAMGGRCADYGASGRYDYKHTFTNTGLAPEWTE